jgi:predicted DNA-binding transcriptional regulator AlpA
MPADYLDMAGIADLLGIDVATIRSLRSKGYLPEPDLMVARSPAWKRSTVEKWAAARPGQGSRTDLRKKGKR